MLWPGIKPATFQITSQSATFNCYQTAAPRTHLSQEYQLSGQLGKRTLWGPASVCGLLCGLGQATVLPRLGLPICYDYRIFLFKNSTDYWVFYKFKWPVTDAIVQDSFLIPLPRRPATGTRHTAHSDSEHGQRPPPRPSFPAAAAERDAGGGSELCFCLYTRNISGPAF